VVPDRGVMPFRNNSGIAFEEHIENAQLALIHLRDARNILVTRPDCTQQAL